MQYASKSPEEFTVGCMSPNLMKPQRIARQKGSQMTKDTHIRHVTPPNAVNMLSRMDEPERLVVN